MNMDLRLEGEGKFWEIVQQGQRTISAFGKLGSAGRTDSHIHYQVDAATKFAESKVKEKTRKGYKKCGKAKVCPAFLKPKYSKDFVQDLDDPKQQLHASRIPNLQLIIRHVLCIPSESVRFARTCVSVCLCVCVFACQWSI